MSRVLHITSGDGAGGSLTKAGLPGEVFVWHDVLYDGPRGPGWPDEATLRDRAVFLEGTTGGGLDRKSVIETLVHQYRVLEKAAADRPIVLWFDACLFDQSMLAHVLTCLDQRNARDVELLCVDAFPGVDPYHGLGQLTPEQLASKVADRRPVTSAQFRFAEEVDRAFASQDEDAQAALASMTDAPLPWVPAAVERWLQERPDPHTGLGRLDDMALSAVRAGCEKPGSIYASVSAAETPPQYWGDITLWARINGLADRDPPLVTIDGPADRLPQWKSDHPLRDFRITPVDQGEAPKAPLRRRV